jgi:hypothetical protein
MSGSQSDVGYLHLGRGTKWRLTSDHQIYTQGPPYPLRNQGLGGQPDVIPDVPITAVFLVLYLVFGVIHIKIFKANKGRGHKFIFNGAILGMRVKPRRMSIANIL